MVSNTLTRLPDAAATASLARRRRPSAAPLAPTHTRTRIRITAVVVAALRSVRLPEPFTDHTRPDVPPAHDSAAARGVWMRRRGDPNP